MSSTHREQDQVYAVVRLDLDAGEREHEVTVKEVVWSLELAQAEVARLNELNAEKGSRYFWRATRLVRRPRQAVRRSNDSLGGHRAHIQVYHDVSDPISEDEAPLGGHVSRLSISVRVAGDGLDTDEITRLMGVARKFTARKGDQVQRGSRVVTQQISIWTYGFRGDPSPEWELDDAVNAHAARDHTKHGSGWSPRSLSENSRRTLPTRRRCHSWWAPARP